MELGICPACTRNLWRFWCAFMCSPYQSLFVNVTQHHYDSTFSVWVVDAFNFTVHPQYAADIYDSCKEGKNQNTTKKNICKYTPLYISKQGGRQIHIHFIISPRKKKLIDWFDWFFYSKNDKVHIGNTGIIVRKKFPDYLAFFNWIIESSNPQPRININYDSSPTSFRSAVTKCQESCSCEECSANCYILPGITLGRIFFLSQNEKC